MDYEITDTPTPTIYNGRIAYIYPVTYVNKHDDEVEAYALAFRPASAISHRLVFSRKKKLFFLLPEACGDDALQIPF